MFRDEEPPLKLNFYWAKPHALIGDGVMRHDILSNEHSTHLSLSKIRLTRMHATTHPAPTTLPPKQNKTGHFLCCNAD